MNKKTKKIVQAAVNMLTRTLSIDLKPDNIWVTSLEPGWVQTDMGGDGAQLTVREYVRCTVDDIVRCQVEFVSTELVKSIKKLDEDYNGCFCRFDLVDVPF